MLYEAWLASENEMDSEAEESAPSAAQLAGTQVFFRVLKVLALLVQPYKH